MAIGTAIVLLVLFSLNSADPSSDIRAIFEESQRILAGENPYVRTLTGNMRDNDKYPTLLPLFYLFGSLAQLLGLREFDQWIFFWQVIFLGCHVGIAFVILRQFTRQNLVLLGLVAFWAFLLNRWALAVLSLSLTDPLALLLLVVSVVLLNKYRITALLLFGTSLAIKQVGIFLFPLYLIWVWQTSPSEKKLKQLIRDTLIVLSVPVLVSLPFIIWSPAGFTQSILFSATRAPVGGDLLSLDAKLSDIEGLSTVLIGIRAKVFALFLMGLTYAAAWKYRLDRSISALLIFLIFTGFNSVYFPQYTYWVFPFLLLSILPSVKLRSSQ